MDLVTYNKAVQVRESINYLSERISWLMPVFEEKDTVTDITIHLEKSSEFSLSLTKKETLKVLEAIDRSLHDQINKLEVEFKKVSELCPVHFGEDFVLDVRDRDTFLKICKTSLFDFANCEVSYKLHKDESAESNRIYNYEEVEMYSKDAEHESITLIKIEIGKVVHRIPFMTFTL